MDARLCYKHALSCPTLCDPLDYSSPGSSVRGISQARTLGWVAISFSRDLPDPGTEPTFPVSPAWQADSLPVSHQRKPRYFFSKKD